MNEQCFQKIYECLAEILPKNWNNVIFRADYEQGSYGMKFYVDCGDGAFTDCYDLPDASKSRYVRTFMEIDKILTPERAGLSDKDRWHVMTMIFDARGGFKTEYEYRDISENLLGYYEEWEKKYL